MENPLNPALSPPPKINTTNGNAMKLATAAQMRAMDQATFRDYGMPSIVLMENAALRIVDEIAARLGPLGGKTIAVVCGKGNNGGDGLAVARHLHTRFGADVRVWLAAAPAALTGDALANYDMARKFGVPIQDAAKPGDAFSRADMIVDALLGTGIKGGVEGELALVIAAINDAHKPTVSVDVPSGLDADTGRVDGACVRATVTVTLALAKIGLWDFPGQDYVGELVVADIGMPRPVMQADNIQVSLTQAADIARWLPPRTEGNSSNKGTFGTALLFAGSQGMVGAAVLCAEAAARTGAGLTTLAVPQDAQSIVMSRINPVVMTRGLPQTEHGAFAAQALEPALALTERGGAAAIGPGLGGTHDDQTRAFVHGFVSRCRVPLVVDADALNILSMQDDQGASLVKGRAAPTILTPHPGEMGRLLGMDTQAVQADRRQAVERAAALFGCTVLLKGARTWVASPDGALNINATGNAGMASGGMGDTLTGIITALLACGLGAHEAASAGAYLHGLAGDLVKDKQGGKAGLLATDIIDMLPRALARCHAPAPKDN